MTRSNCKLPKPSARRTLRAKALNSCSCVPKVFETSWSNPEGDPIRRSDPRHRIRSTRPEEAYKHSAREMREIEALVLARTWLSLSVLRITNTLKALTGFKIVPSCLRSTGMTKFSLVVELSIIATNYKSIRFRRMHRIIATMRDSRTLLRGCSCDNAR